MRKAESTFKRPLATRSLAALVFSVASVAGINMATAQNVEFVVLEPGHFHAALVHKSSIEGVSKKIHVYAPLGFDLTEHIKRIIGFNTRAETPTDWDLEVHASTDYVRRMQIEKRGNVVVISGRNKNKIDLIRAAIDAGMHVLVDKPWIIEASDYPKLKEVVDLAQKKKLVALDIMTERQPTTNVMERELVNTPEIFGTLEKGTPENPGVYIEDMHYFMKVVSGKPLTRPAWYFDSKQQGEALSDTGAHIVDLVQWMVMPGKPVDFDRDVEVIAAQRWPTRIKKADFAKVTGEAEFPDFLAENVTNGVLDVYANGQVTYKIDGVHVKAASMWGWQAGPGAGDWKYAVYRGSKSTVEVRQGRREKFRSELYVVPGKGADRGAIKAALEAKVKAVADRWPGMTVKDRGRELQVEIPDALRTGHEAHFGEVTQRFLGYLKDQKAMPNWEYPNLLAKYRTTTGATELARKGKPQAIRPKAPK